MRSIILCAVLVTVCFFLEVQGNCQHEGRDLSVGTHYINCKQYTCHSDGHITVLACPLYRCAEGKQTGYRQEDLNKPYPECCEGPICAE